MQRTGVPLHAPSVPSASTCRRLAKHLRHTAQSVPCIPFPLPEYQVAGALLVSLETVSLSVRHASRESIDGMRATPSCVLNAPLVRLLRLRDRAPAAYAKQASFPARLGRHQPLHALHVLIVSMPPQGVLSAWRLAHRALLPWPDILKCASIPSLAPRLCRHWQDSSRLCTTSRRANRFVRTCREGLRSLWQVVAVACVENGTAGVWPPKCSMRSMLVQWLLSYSNDLCFTIPGDHSTEALSKPRPLQYHRRGFHPRQGKRSWPRYKLALR